MKTKNKMLTVGLVFLTLLPACQKEPNNRLTLSAEGMGGREKMTVNGLSSYWQTGDAININGEESSVTVNGSQAYVEGAFSVDNYCIVFPSSIYQRRSGSAVTVNMPASYQYKTSGGRQVLNAPMAYYGTADNGNVMMKHLTGALNVQITGPSGISIDRITIETLPSRRMNGEMVFDLSDIENIGSTEGGSSYNNNDYVQMLFDEEAFSVGTVQIPIPVLTGNLRFYVKVEGHIEGTKYTFERYQNTGGHLGRAELGTVAVDLNEGQPDVTTSALFPTTTVGGITYYEISTPQDLRMMSEAIRGTYYREDGDYVHRGWLYNGLNYNEANFFISANIDMEGIKIKSGV